MKKVLKKITEKYVTEGTFERHMESIAKSFDLHQKVMEDMLKEIKQIHEDNKYFRENIVNLYKEDSSFDKKISVLDVRVRKLESR